jgi:hypothetical protein
LWLTPIILTTEEAEIRRTAVRGQPRGNSLRDPISKITTAKWTRSVTQVIEHLLCKCESLSSNSSPTKK